MNFENLNHLAPAVVQVRGAVEKAGGSKKKKGDRALLKKGNDSEMLPAFEEDESFEEYAQSLFDATGCESLEGAVALLNSSAFALGSSRQSKDATITAFNMIGNLLRSLEPKDPVEGMLCSQAIVCQMKAFDYLARINAEDSTNVVKTYNNAASKLLARAQSAIQTLANYRRGGNQKMIVEHVNISPGAQAAIGTFECNSIKNQGG